MKDPTRDGEPLEDAASHGDVDAPRASDVAAWARRRRRDEEDALGPEGRILLALSLGLRARALAALGRR